MSHAYEGFYARFETPSKKYGSLLMNADNIVGDSYEVFFKTEDGRSVAWVKNKFGGEIGFLDADSSRKLQLAAARDMTICALLSFVAYSDTPDPGLYWGEVAIICYNPIDANEMEAFVKRVASKIGDGIRPDINLGSAGVEKIFSESEWIPQDTVPFPKKEKGMAILKDHQSMSEKMIEQGRAGNKGCYAVSIAFIIVVAAALVYGVLKMFGVL